MWASGRMCATARTGAIAAIGARVRRHGVATARRVVGSLDGLSMSGSVRHHRRARRAVSAAVSLARDRRPMPFFRWQRLSRPQPRRSPRARAELGADVFLDLKFHDIRIRAGGCDPPEVGARSSPSASVVNRVGAPAGAVIFRWRVGVHGRHRATSLDADGRSRLGPSDRPEMEQR